MKHLLIIIGLLSLATLHSGSAPNAIQQTIAGAPIPSGGGGGGGGTFTVVTNYAVAGDNNTVTATFNTTGVKLLIIGAGWYQGTPTLSNGSSDTTTTKTKYGSGNLFNQISYIVNPTASATYTVTLAGGSTFPGLCILALNCSATVSSPFDQDSGAAGSGTSTTRTAAAAAVPTVDNEIVVASMTSGLHIYTPTIDSGFSTPVVAADGSGVNYFMSYLIQTTKGSVQPTWTLTGQTGIANQTGLSQVSFAPQ